MSAKDNSGPAFPTHDFHKRVDGMTLRDYFAAKAMQSLFDSDAGHSPSECAMIAAESYAMADAMLKARAA